MSGLVPQGFVDRVEQAFADPVALNELEAELEGFDDDAAGIRDHLLDRVRQYRGDLERQSETDDLVLPREGRGGG